METRKKQDRVEETEGTQETPQPVITPPEFLSIMKGIDIVGKGLWIKKHKVLVIGDLHIGYEEALAKSGILVPKRSFAQERKELEELIQKTRPHKIIINGDVKHEFGEISQQEWRDSLEMIRMIKDYCEDIVLVRGNHDKILEPLADRMQLKIVDSYFIPRTEKKGAHDLSIPSICFVHGDKIINNSDTKNAEVIVIGHEHPAISLSEGEKVEKYKCFLAGKWKKQELIVIPSFFPLIEGTDVTKERLLSPYLHHDIGNFDVYVVADDKAYKFGSLKNLD